MLHQPRICSLDELKIELPDDVRRHLSSQYEALYSGVEETLSVNEKEREDTSASIKEAADQHLDRILNAMKKAPATTVCHVNNIQSTREEVIIGLDEALTPWIRRRRGLSNTGPGHPTGFANRDCHETNARSSLFAAAMPPPGNRHVGDKDNNEKMVLSLVRPHPILNDVIVIDSLSGNDQSGRNDNEPTSPRMSNRSIPPSWGTDIDNSTPSNNNNDGGTKEEQNNILFAKWTKRAEKGWPITHRVIICDRLCGEAVLRGSNVFVKGVLVADAGIKNGEIVALYADLNDSNSQPVPRGLLLEKYGGHCVFLGLGTARCDRSEMFSRSKGLAVDMSTGCSGLINNNYYNNRAGPDLPPLNGILTSKMMLQNLPSVLVGHALDVRPGDTILDMCSAPGGKASHAASLVRNDGLIVACDKSRKKMITARKLFVEMGATCIIPIALDSTNCVVRDGSSWKSVKEVLSSALPSKKYGLLNVKAFYPNSFDRIMLDPPCSALGLRPKLRIDAQTLADLLKHGEYQRMFVGKAVALLKPGGTMTYSTCTINASENERMVRHILDDYPCMNLVPIQFDIGLAGLPGMGLSHSERAMVRRFDPSDAADTMGFFVAKFVKMF